MRRDVKGLSLSPCPRRSTETTRCWRGEVLGLRGEERAIASPPVHEDKRRLAAPRSSKASLVRLCTIIGMMRFLSSLGSTLHDVNTASPRRTRAWAYVVRYTRAAA